MNYYSNYSTDHMQIDCLHCSEWFSQETVIFAPHSTFWLDFLMETVCVCCETGADIIWQYPLLPCVPLPGMALSTDWLPPPGCKHRQQMQSSCCGYKPQKAIEPTFFSSALNQDGTSVLLSKIPFIVTGFPCHKPSDVVSVHIWLKGPRDLDLSLMQVSALSSLFGLLVWLPW